MYGSLQAKETEEKILTQEVLALSEQKGRLTEENEDLLVGNVEAFMCGHCMYCERKIDISM